MESPTVQPQAVSASTPRKKMTKQLTGKRDDTPLHSAARAGNLSVLKDTVSGTEGGELRALLTKQNHAGETVLYVAAEYGYVDMVREMIQYYDLAGAGIKARNGFDALHIAAKQGDLDIVKILMEAHSELSMTVDPSNTTALHTAALQGHIEIVKFLLEAGSSLATIARSNGKTALHSAARNGHVEVVEALLEKEPAVATRTDKKGQTALHMAVKGQNLEVVEELIKADPSTVNMVDNKGNTPLHIATRKGRAQIMHVDKCVLFSHVVSRSENKNSIWVDSALLGIHVSNLYLRPRSHGRILLKILALGFYFLKIVKLLLGQTGTDSLAVNKSGETALDTAEKTGNSEVKDILLENGVRSAKALKTQPATATARELKQTVSDIKHEVHDQLEHTRQTRRSVQGIAKRINKLHAEGLNNAINSTTVVAVLIATVAFAAIFTVPGQFADDPKDIPPGSGMTIGEANIAPQAAFLIFFVFDSIALFISLAVVVVQTSVVIIENKAKKQMMAIINKLMWLACVLISVAFLALSFVVVGKDEKWLAIGVTIIGTTIMATTLGTMCYWVIRHRIEASNLRSIRKSSMGSRSRSFSVSVMSDSELLNNEHKILYAI
ncbi:Ankyrin repeat-containing protein [Vigna angularis]|uniref:Ankyrin repeat-containing protein n=1 Tax=Phaseolus angularis TaxID=3914 RepID=A0A8T0L3V0_PHAAN|nr:Ankyrin repeat-containing protein [Vigna angularis]